MTFKSVWFDFRYKAGSYDEALIKAEQALEIEEKELGARDERMAGLYHLLARIWGQVGTHFWKVAHFLQELPIDAIARTI